MRKPSDDFLKMLHNLDPALTCYFNPMKGKFTIDRCTNPEASSLMHKCTFNCLKTHVMFVEDEQGLYREPAGDIIGKLMSMDMWRHGSLENMQIAEANVEAEDEAKREAQVDETYKHAAVENKAQLRKAFHLIQQHNTAEIH